MTGAAIAIGESAGRSRRHRAPRTRARPLALCLATAVATLTLAAPRTSFAFEAFNGRLELHGYVETQIRMISDDFNDELDLTQWAWILNLELELGLLEDSVGIFDLVEAYARIEARFDCVYYNACGMVRSGATYGDQAKSLPRRLKGGSKIIANGVIPVGIESLRAGTGQSPVSLGELSPLDVLVPWNPNAFAYVYERSEDFRFSQLEGSGGRDGGITTRRLGPWLPKNFVRPIGQLSDRVNVFDSSQIIPFDGVDGDPIAKPGFGALPFRPIPVEDPSRDLDKRIPAGLHYPSPALIGLLDSKKLDSFDFNFNQTQRAFNRGASQQQTGELKELYFDIEMFDSRLWLRLGKQTIVWGKTELFRTIDQFNPQDFALSSIPGLEESRVPLWAVRGVWSFYEVGPLDDVRLEVAFNYDEFKPHDVGACGEPYAIDVVCELVLGGYFHGLLGVTFAGVDRPRNPWEGIQGWEGGARLEFRWGPLSVAISDFYGFSDLFHVDPIGYFERNVDPLSGRPRFATSRSGCLTERDAARLNAMPSYVSTYGAATPDTRGCLSFGPIDRDDPDNPALLADPRNALLNHPANQAAFAVSCASTVGFRPDFDSAACTLSVFNSPNTSLDGSPFTIAQATSAVLAGGPNVTSLLALPPDLGGVGVVMPTVQLGIDAFDGVNAGVIGDYTGLPCRDTRFDVPCSGPGNSPFVDFFSPDPSEALGDKLTPEQAALLGCGPFHGTNCDDSGVDLLNMDATVLFQAWPGLEGTTVGWRTDDASVAQPGTVGYRGIAPICTQAVVGGPLDPNLRSPGCRGVGEPGYDVRQDGSNLGLQMGEKVADVIKERYFELDNAGNKQALKGHPLTGQTWANELAVVSWNYLLLTVAQSTEFKPENAWEAGECSFLTPSDCGTVREFLELAGNGRPSVVAGGNETFGRRSFLWHTGAEAVLRYPKRNVLGLAIDFAEDRSKSNVSLEFAWINDVLVTDNSSLDGTAKVDDLSLSLSLDRPTFINFLNANRTFFFNVQLFMQYRAGYHDGVAGNGPWNVLGTFTAQTGYFQDRLLPTFTFVYDVQSASGAGLVEIQYRVSPAFSVAVGTNLFFGRTQLVDMPVRGIPPNGNRRGPDAYMDGEENGLSPFRTRDELYARLRYTF